MPISPCGPTRETQHITLFDSLCNSSPVPFGKVMNLGWLWCIMVVRPPSRSRWLVTVASCQPLLK